MRATIQPPEAGAIRVTVLRNGEQTFEAAYRTQARVGSHPSTARSRCRRRSCRDRLRRRRARGQHAGRIPALSYGSASPAVADLWSRLAALHYVVPSVAVADVRRRLRAERLRVPEGAGPRAHRRRRRGVLAAARPSLDPEPRYRKPAAHIEIDKTRQVLSSFANGEVALVSPVSTAGIPGYYTPDGRFAIYRKVIGYDPSPLGVLLDPMYFVGGYAIHGNPSVPPYPASHGCIRVPNFVITGCSRTEPYGETVYVY